MNTQTATLICPKCQHEQAVDIPETGCLSFHECEACGEFMAVPMGSDNCCVICEYSDKNCPISQKK